MDVTRRLPAPPSSGRVTSAELAGVGMLACLPADALDALAASALRRFVAAGERLFAEGDPGDALYLVRSGRLKVVGATGGEGLVLSLLEARSVFGELAVLTGAPRSATIVAIERSELIELRSGDVNAVLEGHPRALRLLVGWLGRSLTVAKEALTRENQRLELRVRERTRSLRETQLELVRRLGQIAEARDYGSRQHVTRVGRLSASLGRAAGLAEPEAEMLLHAAAMHDIGKVALPDSILLKEGPLEADEWERMKLHTTIGAEILSDSGTAVLRLAETIALTHHERWDGRGYPRGLTGEKIPLVGRIVAVCDAFDALTSPRPYKSAWTAVDALAEIQRERGRHFDPRLVDLFIAQVAVSPLGAGTAGARAT